MRKTTLRLAAAATLALVAGCIVSDQIIASQGFTVAGHKRSALLEPAKIEGLFQTEREQVELFLEWELASK